MPPVGFEPIISAGERPKTYTFDRAATAGTGCNTLLHKLNVMEHIWVLLGSAVFGNFPVNVSSHLWGTSPLRFVWYYTK
jgi:hypothetical protein